MLKSRRFVSSFVSQNIFKFRAQVRKQAQAIQSEPANQCVQHCQAAGHAIKHKLESKDVKSEQKGSVQDPDICGMQVNVPRYVNLLGEVVSIGHVLEGWECVWGWIFVEIKTVNSQNQNQVTVVRDRRWGKTKQRDVWVVEGHSEPVGWGKRAELTILWERLYNIYCFWIHFMEFSYGTILTRQ